MQGFMAIIALLYGSHCHGERIAQQVAERLGYRNIDDELFRTASERFSVSPERLLRSLTGPPAFFNKFTNEGELYPAYFETVLAELVLTDSVILTNHAAYMIPGHISHALKVCLIANHDFRIKRSFEKDNVSEADADAAIQEYDQKMSHASSLLQDKSAYDESLFDMVIPMHDTTVDGAVAQICVQAQSDALKTTEKSRKSVEDYVLSTKINLTLTKSGHKTSVYSENGRVIISTNEQSLLMGKLESKLRKIAEAQPGVTEVTTRLGPKFEPPSLNPWDKVDVPPRIMLVDDEKEFVHTLSERLKTRHFESSIAYDGEQALDMLNQDVPDVMVLDLMMPGIDGIETLRRVKEAHPEVEVIILTGHGSDKEQAAAEDLGAFAYLRKPVNINELARKMKEAHARHKRNA